MHYPLISKEFPINIKKYKNTNMRLYNKENIFSLETKISLILMALITTAMTFLEQHHGSILSKIEIAHKNAWYMYVLTNTSMILQQTIHKNTSLKTNLIKLNITYLINTSIMLVIPLTLYLIKTTTSTKESTTHYFGILGLFILSTIILNSIINIYTIKKHGTRTNK